MIKLTGNSEVKLKVPSIAGKSELFCSSVEPWNLASVPTENIKCTAVLYPNTVIILFMFLKELLLENKTLLHSQNSAHHTALHSSIVSRLIIFGLNRSLWSRSQEIFWKFIYQTKSWAGRPLQWPDECDSAKATLSNVGDWNWNGPLWLAANGLTQGKAFNNFKWLVLF